MIGTDTCGKCNAPATAKVTDGKAIIKVCPAHLAQFLKWDWRRVWSGKEHADANAG